MTQWLMKPFARGLCLRIHVVSWRRSGDVDGGGGVGVEDGWLGGWGESWLGGSKISHIPSPLALLSFHDFPAFPFGRDMLVPCKVAFFFAGD